VVAKSVAANVQQHILEVFDVGDPCAAKELGRDWVLCEPCLPKVEAQFPRVGEQTAKRKLDWSDASDVPAVAASRPQRAAQDCVVGDVTPVRHQGLGHRATVEENTFFFVVANVVFCMTPSSLVLGPDAACLPRGPDYTTVLLIRQSDITHA
jgi:hypothetical protein